MRIDGYSFGKIVIDGAVYTDDVLIVRGAVQSPWWRTAGGHVFRPEDLRPLFEARPDVVCLGTGYFGRVRIEDATEAAFSEIGSRLEIGPTRQMVEAFNRLVRAGTDAAAALHLTC